MSDLVELAVVNLFKTFLSVLKSVPGQRCVEGGAEGPVPHPVLVGLLADDDGLAAEEPARPPLPVEVELEGGLAARGKHALVFNLTYLIILKLSFSTL